MIKEEAQKPTLRSVEDVDRFSKVEGVGVRQFWSMSKDPV